MLNEKKRRFLWVLEVVIHEFIDIRNPIYFKVFTYYINDF